MKRSGGITFSAVIAIIGSVVSVLLGGLTVVTSIALRDTPIPTPPSGYPASPIAPAVTLLITSIFYLGFGVWGIVSAIGLFRLRNWARICFAVFGGLLGVFSLFGAVALFVLSRFPPPGIPQSPDVPAGFIESLFTIIAVIALMFAALGIWWMIFFNRRRVKVQFLSEAAAAAPRQFPLSISIIAWFLAVAGVLLLPYSMLPFPMFIFSFALHGATAHILFLLMAVVSLLSGIGMLKKRVEAHSLAVGYFAFSILNSVATFVLPGSQARRLAFFNEFTQGQLMPIPINLFFVMSILFGLVIVGLCLWFLTTRRRAFVEACSR